MTLKWALTLVFGWVCIFCIWPTLVSAKNTIRIVKNEATHRVYLQISTNDASPSCERFESIYTDIIQWSESLATPQATHPRPPYNCSQMTLEGRQHFDIEVTGILPPEVLRTLNSAAPCNGVNCRGTVRKLKGGQKYTGFCGFEPFNQFLSQNCSPLGANDALHPGDVGAFTQLSTDLLDPLRNYSISRMTPEEREYYNKHFYDALKVEHAFFYVSPHLAYGKNGGTDLQALKSGQRNSPGTPSMDYQFDPLDDLIDIESTREVVSSSLQQRLTDRSNPIENTAKKNTLIFFRCGNSQKVWQDPNYETLSQLNEQAIHLMTSCHRQGHDPKHLQETDELFQSTLDTIRGGPVSRCPDPHQELDSSQGLLRQIANTRSALVYYLDAL